MGRRSTRVTNWSLFQFTCDACWDGLNSSAGSWAAAEAEARAGGWTFEGRGMSARDYCGRCS